MPKHEEENRKYKGYKSIIPLQLNQHKQYSGQFGNASWLHISKVSETHEQLH